MSSGDAALRRALRSVPVFPLPDVVLFPHALLPLHIFEPRYRAMIRDVLASDKLMVVARLLEQQTLGEVPQFAEMAGVGEVVLAQELPDGRFHIVLKGRGRVQIERELPSETLYRRVAARLVPDRPARSPAEMAEAESSLRAMVSGLAEALPEGGELLKQVAAAQGTPAELVDVLAASLVADATVRQGLLETTDVLVRIERVTTEVAALTGKVTPDPKAN